MWSRVELKTRAKAVLSKGYWRAFLISLVIMLVGGSQSSGGNGSNSNEYRQGIQRFNIEYEAIIIIIIIVMVIALIRILLGYIVEVGGRKYFVRAAEDDMNMSYLGFGFGGGRYIGIIKSMFYKDVLIFLWTLLLIIPGIVKGYAYRMVPYILADNPNIGYDRAVELSNEMTMGYKWDIFVLDLSFLGWYFLGALALGIGTLFVRPYDDSTNAELYLVLRENAISSRMCTWEELNPREEQVF